MKVVAASLTIAVIGACVTVGPPPQKDDCGDRALSAKEPPWLDVDRQERLKKPDALLPALRAAGVGGGRKHVTAWVGVDGDGTVFCTAVRDVPTHTEYAIRRVLEVLEYTPAVVKGRPHYAYLPLYVPLWEGENDEACSDGVADACNWLASERARAGDHNGEAAALERGCALGDQAQCAGFGEALAAGHGVTKDRPRAITLLEKACEAKPALCGKLHDVVMYEPGVDRKRLFDLAMRACEVFHAGSCRSVGFKLDYGTGTDFDPERATAFYEEACARSNATACRSLAERYSRGWGVPQDKARGRALAERLCSKSEQECDDIGFDIVAEGGTLADAVPFVRRTCDAGLAALKEKPEEHDARLGACGTLIRWRARGANPDVVVDIGAVDEDAIRAHMNAWCEKGKEHASVCVSASRIAVTEEEAQRLLEKGCAHENAASCKQLARRRARAGAIEDASRLSKEACRFDQEWSCSLVFNDEDRVDRLATLEKKCATDVCTQEHVTIAELSLALAQRRPQHARWLEVLRRECPRDAHACHALARVVGSADGAMSAMQSAALFRQACELGDGEACFDLGGLYRLGKGVARDEAKALSFERRGCLLDSEFCAATQATPAATPATPPTIAPAVAPSGP